MGKLTGKVAVITGGNGGLGLATAKLFVAEGAYVYITGRRQEELDKAVKEIGGNVTGVQGDVSKLADLDRLYAAVKAGHGRIDLLVANAGLGTLGPLGHITEEAYYLTFDVNVKGTIFTVQKALPLMQAGGSIVVTGSTAGVTGTPAFSIYSASKAAIRNLARSWAMDLKGTGIRVNVLSPGATDTPALRQLGALTGGKDELYASFVSQTPLGRVSDPEDVAAVTLFLASEDSRSMTATEVFADGGSAQV
ncbi:MAG TPA: SDR family oxidoreductase [Acidobacteriaceae bacterium]|jgi:NAD(P)-dependent dehydrogenase (short-subunit alcohol dehydrogenase family)